MRSLAAVVDSILLTGCWDGMTDDEHALVVDTLNSKLRRPGRSSGLTAERAEYELRLHDAVMAIQEKYDCSLDAAIRKADAWSNEDVCFELESDSIKKIVYRVKRRDKAMKVMDEKVKESRPSLQNPLQDIYDEQHNDAACCPSCGAPLP